LREIRERMSKKNYTEEEYLEIQAGSRKKKLDWFIEPVFETVSPGDRYVHNWHIDCISEHLHAVYDGEIKNIIINICPGSTKSILCNVALPAWLLGQDPTTRILSASYSGDLAKKFSALTRLVLEQQWYKSLFPDTVISADENEKRKFVTTRRGFRMATSVGGSATGEHADWLILDDPQKPDEALSETLRHNTNFWTDNTFLTRKVDKRTSKTVLVMQRLHEDDTTGHLLETGNWFHLKIPAICEEHTKYMIGDKKVAERNTGELIDPVRLPKDILEEERRTLGEYAYAGQFQQRPSPLGGWLLQRGLVTTRRLWPL